MFKVGDIVMPSENNAESLSNGPIPKYKITQIGMGRVFAKNMETGEIVDLAEDGTVESAENYYTPYEESER